MNTDRATWPRRALLLLALAAIALISVGIIAKPWSYTSSPKQEGQYTNQAGQTFGKPVPPTPQVTSTPSPSPTPWDSRKDTLNDYRANPAYDCPGNKGLDHTQLVKFAPCGLNGVIVVRLSGGTLEIISTTTNYRVEDGPDHNGVDPTTKYENPTNGWLFELSTYQTNSSQEKCRQLLYSSSPNIKRFNEYQSVDGGIWQGAGNVNDHCHSVKQDYTITFVFTDMTNPSTANAPAPFTWAYIAAQNADAADWCNRSCRTAAPIG